ncbi:MAG TPA: PEGA domain-containing protein [Candidatus Saccharimonadales bacterium]|jgi:hypothetical protein
MDFLDPKKQRAHMIRLIVGYILLGVAVLFGTLILLYQAYGFGLGKDGEVIQKGLVFMSSQPTRAQIYLDGMLRKDRTNTKLQLEAGQYKAELKREGYRDWLRLITVEGGSVQHFDYPKLFPAKLVTTNIKNYTAAPAFASQSPDRRWLVLQQPGTMITFDLFDLADPQDIAANSTTVAVQENLLTAARPGSQSWKLVEWSTNNRHILLQHVYTPLTNGAAETSEYILVDRQVPTESVNLSRLLSLPSGRQLALRDKKHDLYYVFDAAARSLATTSIDDAGKLTPLLENVLSYKPYGANMVLYVSDTEPAAEQGLTAEKPLPAGKVVTMLRDRDQTYKIREHSAMPPYLTDMAEYGGDWYVASGSAGDGKINIYKNPQQIRKSSQTATLVPVHILKVDTPNKLTFSSNTEFLMASNGTQFAVYDAETDKGYRFISPHPLDPPAAHATWMDGHRITYVSEGKLKVLDYDNINVQTLSPASPNYLPFFDRDYDTLYTLIPTVGQQAGAMTMTATSMLIPEDQ